MPWVKVFECRPGWSMDKMVIYSGDIEVDVESMVEKLERLGKNGIVLVQTPRTLEWKVFGTPSVSCMEYFHNGEWKEV